MEYGIFRRHQWLYILVYALFFVWETLDFSTGDFCNFVHGSNLYSQVSERSEHFFLSLFLLTDLGSQLISEVLYLCWHDLLTFRKQIGYHFSPFKYLLSRFSKSVPCPYGWIPGHTACLAMRSPIQLLRKQFCMANWNVNELYAVTFIPVIFTFSLREPWGMTMI
jgi:hypothetical protein